MLLIIDQESTQPIHDQLAGQLRRSIATGDLPPDEKLAPARELASGLGVNVHTVLRALAILRDEGLLEIQRGRGTTVTGRAPQKAKFAQLARQLVSEARRSGLSNSEIRQTLELQL